MCHEQDAPDAGLEVLVGRPDRHLAEGLFKEGKERGVGSLDVDGPVVDAEGGCKVRGIGNRVTA